MSDHEPAKVATVNRTDVPPKAPRTVKPDYQPRKSPSSRDWLKRRVCMTRDRSWFGHLFFKTIVKVAPLTKNRVADKAIKHVAMMGGQHSTAGYSVPARVDLEASQAQAAAAVEGTRSTLEVGTKIAVEPVHPPIELIRDSLARADYRAIMNGCLCRETFDCQHYPHDFGCLFMGDAARACVANGIAHEATLEECYAHLDKARELGLPPSAYWVEVEEFVWGFENRDIPQFMEICFCCDCCCAAVQFHNRAHGELKNVLQNDVGWQCRPLLDRCVGCGTCVSACPFGYLVVDETSGKVGVAERCIGCGRCLDACKRGALHVVQTGKTEERLEDYFPELHLKL